MVLPKKRNERICGFPSNADRYARILILGSMPSVASLGKREYYAYQYNAFWKIMGELFHFDPGLPYAERLALLRKNHIALWDVAGSCVREGSLDSNIREVVPNDIPGLLKNSPGIGKILCNGGTAWTLLRKYHRALFDHYSVIRMPSTSPAAASLRFEEKLAAYRRELSGVSL